MKGLEVLTIEKANPESAEILKGIKEKIGKIPNIYAIVAHSPAALKAVLTYGGNLGKGELSQKEIEAVALSVGQENDCGYCLAAHTTLGKSQGFSEEETIDLRKGTIADPKLKALTLLAKDIVATKGYPSDKSISEFLSAGYSKGALVELIAVISLNLFTNYFNHIAETPIDFPEAKKL